MVEITKYIRGIIVYFLHRQADLTHLIFCYCLPLNILILDKPSNASNIFQTLFGGFSSVQNENLPTPNCRLAAAAPGAENSAVQQLRIRRRASLPFQVGFFHRIGWNRQFMYYSDREIVFYFPNAKNVSPDKWISESLSFLKGSLQDLKQKLLAKSVAISAF